MALQFSEEYFDKLKEKLKELEKTEIVNTLDGVEGIIQDSLSFGDGVEKFRKEYNDGEKESK